MSYRIHDTQVDTFTWGYITCLFFTTCEYDFPEYCYPGEFSISKKDADRLTGDALHRIIKDCDEFQGTCKDLLAETDDDLQNGMDFAFARNGHGVSFMDREHSKEVAENLNAVARGFGEIYLFKVGCECYSESSYECSCGDETKIETDR